MVETHVVLGTGPLEGLEMGRDRAPLGGETTDRILEWGRDRDQ